MPRKGSESLPSAWATWIKGHAFRKPSRSATATFNIDGQQVWSKMNGQVLNEIASETNGAYIPAGTRRVNMADVYHRYVANVEQTDFETAKINTYIARYQWFAVPALALLLLDVLLTTRSTGMRARRHSQESAFTQVIDSRANKTRTQKQAA